MVVVCEFQREKAGGVMELPIDPTARRDQLETASRALAELCGLFREALLREGFDREEAQELVAQWLPALIWGTE